MARPRFTFLSSFIFVLVAALAWTLPARSQETKAPAKAELSVTAKPGGVAILEQ